MMRRFRISFGPTRVLDEEQGGGIGRALLLRSLAAMRAEGYAYAVIGGVGPQEFYKVCVGAMRSRIPSPAFTGIFSAG